MVRAFLIGAGATRAQFPSAPLSKDFLEKISEVNGPLFDAIRKVASSLVGSDIRKWDIEDLMFLSYSLEKSHRDLFLANLYSAIWEVLTKTTFDEDIRLYPKGSETIFKRLLCDERLSPEDFFMSLNYDLYLDREIYSIQQSIDYGIDKNFINMNRINGDKVLEFSLYHLHGSLNWRFRPNGRLDISINAIEPKHNRQGTDMCIIPPGIKELNSVLEYIWVKAEGRLERADELIIIGCSLNPDDNELISMLHKFIETGGKVKVIHLAENEESRFYENYDSVFDEYEDYPLGFDIVGMGGGVIEFIFDNTEFNKPRKK